MRTWLRTTRRRLAGEEGYASTAILVPASLILLFLGLQAATWYLGTDAANTAAQAGYTVARAYESDGTAGIATADQLLDGTGLLINPQVAVNRTADTVTVTVTGQPVSLIPGVTFPTITRSHTGPVERWVPAP